MKYFNAGGISEQYKTHIQRGRNKWSTSQIKTPNNWKWEITTINKIQHREWNGEFKKNAQSSGSLGNVTWPRNTPDGFPDLVLRISCFVLFLYPTLWYRKHFLPCSPGLLWESELLTLKMLSSIFYFCHILYWASNLWFLTQLMRDLILANSHLEPNSFSEWKLYFCVATRNCILKGSLIFSDCTAAKCIFYCFPFTGSEPVNFTHGSQTDSIQDGMTSSIAGFESQGTWKHLKIHFY